MDGVTQSHAMKRARVDGEDGLDPALSSSGVTTAVAVAAAGAHEIKEKHGKGVNGSGEEKMVEEDGGAAAVFAPWSCFVRPMLTDLYQLTMAYAYWKNGKT